MTMRDRCPKCGLLSLQATECSRCGIVFEAYERHLVHKRPEPAGVERSQKNEGDEDEDADVPESARVPFDDFKLNLLALPCAILFVVLCKVTYLPDVIFWYLCTIPAHEMGHAIMAWMSGHFAFPLGAIFPAAAFTTISPERSGGVFALVLLMAGFVGYRALRARRWYPLLLSVAAVAAAVYLTFLVDEQTALMFFTYSGVAGEFVLGALLMVSFYYRMPDAWRWDFARLFALGAGTFVFISAYSVWWKVSQGARTMPSGSLLNGSADPGGDLERLQSVYHWTRAELVSSFLTLGKGGATVVAGHYVFFLWKATNRPKTSLN